MTRRHRWAHLVPAHESITGDVSDASLPASSIGLNGFFSCAGPQTARTPGTIRGKNRHTPGRNPRAAG